jgi:DNA-binding CsgD family transcriptional regulator
VTPATVRSQTMSLRRKTGHASVAELLRALAAMPPLGPPMAPGN